ncbi:MAG: hypothetical protein HOP30_11165 [Cyclobacteriaceae bacterium]|nr:hypothetical protein [Cyclobacteriaceae bacterium]
MKSIRLLKIIIKTPGIFSNQGQVEYAKSNLLKKIRRRDKKIVKKTKLKIEL